MRRVRCGFSPFSRVSKNVRIILALWESALNTQTNIQSMQKSQADTFPKTQYYYKYSIEPRAGNLI